MSNNLSIEFFHSRPRIFSLRNKVELIDVNVSVSGDLRNEEKHHVKNENMYVTV